MDEPHIAVLTLFGGRFHTLEAYIHHLAEIDYPKEKMHVVWYCNNKSDLFRGLLKDYKKAIEKEYASFKLVFDDEIRESVMLFEEEDFKYSMMHGKIIANLYNTAWGEVPDAEYVLFLEDDTLPPSHCVRRFLRSIKDEKVASVAGVVFDRHSPRIFHYDLFIGNVSKENGGEEKIAMAVPPSKQWGIQPITMNGLGLTMFKKKVLDEFPGDVFRVTHWQSQYYKIIGCDMILGIMLKEHGWTCLTDFDVRGLHMDSKAQIH